MELILFKTKKGFKPKRKLTELCENLKLCQETFLNYFSGKGITWHLIPPSFPHFGGLWDAVKHYLRRVFSGASLVYYFRS